MRCKQFAVIERFGEGMSNIFTEAIHFGFSWWGGFNFLGYYRWVIGGFLLFRFWKLNITCENFVLCTQHEIRDMFRGDPWLLECAFLMGFFDGAEFGR